MFAISVRSSGLVNGKPPIFIVSRHRFLVLFVTQGYELLVPRSKAITPYLVKFITSNQQHLLQQTRIICFSFRYAMEISLASYKLTLYFKEDIFIWPSLFIISWNP
jgi:hypothetical protein